MRTQQSGSTNEPLSIDAEFFKRLRTIIYEIRNEALAEVAKGQSVSISAVSAIDRGEIPADLPLGNFSEDLPEKARHELEEIDKRYIVERVKNAIDARASVSFNLDYSNGYTFQTNDLGQLVDILETESDTPAEVTVTVGGWASSRLRLALGSKFGSVARYTIDGSRRDVDHIVITVRTLLRGSEPEMAWLHREWPIIFVRIFVFAAFVGAYIFAVLRSAPPKSEWAGVLWLGVAFGAIGSALSTIPANQFKRAFPRCQFEFGAERKHRRTARSVIWATLSVLLIPAAIAWVFATRN